MAIKHDENRNLRILETLINAYGFPYILDRLAIIADEIGQETTSNTEIKKSVIAAKELRKLANNITIV